MADVAFTLPVWLNSTFEFIAFIPILFFPTEILPLEVNFPFSVYIPTLDVELDKSIFPLCVIVDVALL